MSSEWPGLSDAFSLKGNVALVTGGNGGLGRAIALGMCEAGAFVVVTGRDEDKNAVMREELGTRGLVTSADVRDEAAIADIVARAVADHGRLDILVNNAGIGGRAPFLEMDQDAWHTMIDTHLTGAFLATKYAVKAMIAGQRGGSVLNIGSMYSLFGPPQGVGYATAKTGMLGFTRALAVELAEQRIRVNAILPGWIETEMTRMVRESDMAPDIVRKIPLGRFGVPDDLVGLSLLLSSPAGAYITGAEIPVDGGYHASDRPRRDAPTK
ncbi:MAG: short-chain dehydrogenase/reductase [Acidimicrobiaceae bacterium]|jgi:2-deoxy-D-gluconate 3-dehydrogenase|nr:short-chain dehydrogenase/reductase [Acidimicrobiaceae bacterium]